MDMEDVMSGIVTGAMVLGAIALELGLFVAKVGGVAFILFTVGRWIGVF